MIAIATFLVMLLCAYAMYREGLMTAVCYLFATIFSGTVAFQLWGPIATELENSFAGGALQGYEDAVPLVVVFTLVFLGLRYASTAIVTKDLGIPPVASQGGGALVGMLIGYFLSGFIVCMLQTIPWDEQFMGFPESRQDGFDSRTFPPDQVWLKLMNRGSRAAFDRSDVDPVKQSETLEKYAYNFAMYRRFTDTREAKQYQPPLPVVPKGGPGIPGVPGVPGAPTVPGVPTGKDPKKDPPKKEPEKKEGEKKPEEKKEEKNS